MKKQKGFLLGVLVGALAVGGTTAAFADSAIQAFNANIKYKFNGQSVNLPSDYISIGYKDHTYVPARFIAEQLGAKVDYDQNTRTISITKANVDYTPPGDNSGSQSQSGGQTQTQNGDVFNLPYSFHNGDLTLVSANLNEDSKYGGGWQVSYTIKNNSKKYAYWLDALNLSFYDKQGNLLGTSQLLSSAEAGGTDSGDGVFLPSYGHYQEDFDPSQVAKVTYQEE